MKGVDEDLSDGEVAETGYQLRRMRQLYPTFHPGHLRWNTTKLPRRRGLWTVD